jgi:23S rRNA-/tRNA-specific pseudouridylate synthase
MEQFPVAIPEMNEASKDTTSVIWDLGLNGDGGSLHSKIYLKTPDVNGESSKSPQSTGSEQQNYDESLPAELETSVLQYQRQKRKTDASKRAGSAISEEQLHIVYEDDAMMVVNKPGGVLCVPGVHNNPSIANIVFDRLSSQEIPDACPDAYSMTVHR